jgi:hypothetical protein
MSHMTPATLATLDTKSGRPRAAWRLWQHTPILVTENHVGLSTAAAAAVGSTRRRWLDTNLMALLRRRLTAPTQPRPRYPRRELAYFEAARMSRAMNRL